MHRTVLLVSALAFLVSTNADAQTRSRRNRPAPSTPTAGPTPSRPPADGLLTIATVSPVLSDTARASLRFSASTNQFAVRPSATDAVGQSVTFRRRLGFSYNSDAQTLTFTLTGMSWPDRAGLLSDATSSGSTRPSRPTAVLFPFAERQQSLGSYTGGNAYGATREIERSNRTELSVALVGFPSSTIQHTVRLPPEEARLLSQSLELVIEGTITDALGRVSDCETSHLTQTINFTMDVTIKSCWVGVTPTSARIINTRTSEVVQTIPVARQPPRPTVSRYRFDLRCAMTLNRQNRGQQAQSNQGVLIFSVDTVGRQLHVRGENDTMITMPGTNITSVSDTVISATERRNFITFDRTGGTVDMSIAERGTTLSGQGTCTPEPYTGLSLNRMPDLPTPERQPPRF